MLLNWGQGQSFMRWEAIKISLKPRGVYVNLIKSLPGKSSLYLEDRFVSIKRIHNLDEMELQTVDMQTRFFHLNILAIFSIVRTTLQRYLMQTIQT